MSAQSPDSAAPMDELLTALGVDRTQRPFNEPALILDLKRLCAVCEHTQQCVHELAAGTAAEHYRAYCPTAYTLDYMIGRGR
jgi:hypothetical protein